MLYRGISTSLLTLMILQAFPLEGSQLQLSVRPRHNWKVLGVESRHDPSAVITLLFYEWNLFGALEEREHFRGNYLGPWSTTDDGRQIQREMDQEGMELQVTRVEDGAELELKVTNRSTVDWPALASIVPCLSAGEAHIRDAPDQGFFDPRHQNTYFLGPDGLELLIDREIHFNKGLSGLLKQYSPTAEFEFSSKWPTSDRCAVAGILIRESEDREWVTGIAWERFLAAQGHNPLKCMHLSVQVGPLKQRESRQIRGKIYLLRGTKDDCLQRFKNDFGAK